MKTPTAHLFHEVPHGVVVGVGEEEAQAVHVPCVALEVVHEPRAGPARTCSVAVTGAERNSPNPPATHTHPRTPGGHPVSVATLGALRARNFGPRRGREALVLSGPAGAQWGELL